MQNGRKTQQRLDGRIPAFAVGGGEVVSGGGAFVLVEPALRLNNVKRVGGGGQQLREQRVWIQRDRREHCFKFGEREFLRRWLLRRLRLG